MQQFNCVCCGAIDPGLVCYEPIGSACTLCGTVVQECPWESNCTTLPMNNDANIPIRALRVFQDLEIEPVDEWWNVVLRTEKGCVKDVLSVIATQHPCFKSGPRLTRLLDYARTMHNLRPEHLFANNRSTQDQDIYAPLVIRLCEMIPMSYGDQRVLRCQIADALFRVPQLELRMPNAVVVAVYLKRTNRNSFSIVDVCRWMNISTTTVRKTMTLI